MKTILHKKLDLTHAVDVTPACEKMKIFRTALDSYAVATADSKYACFAFKCEAFSKLLHTFSSPVLDVVATTSASLLTDDTRSKIELTVMLEDGTAYRIDEDSRIESIVPITMVDKEEQPTLEAQEIFNLPDLEPYNRILFSADFYFSIIPSLNEGENRNGRSFINELWHNFRTIKGGPHVDRVVFSKSTDTRFAATELTCGRILFLTTFEGREITFPNAPHRKQGGKHARN